MRVLYQSLQMLVHVFKHFSTALTYHLTHVKLSHCGKLITTKAKNLP